MVQFIKFFLCGSWNWCHSLKHLFCRGYEIIFLNFLLVCMVFVVYFSLGIFQKYHVMSCKVWIQFYFSNIAMAVYQNHLLSCNTIGFSLIWDIIFCLFTQFFQQVVIKCWVCVTIALGTGNSAGYKTSQTLPLENLYLNRWDRLQPWKVTYYEYCYMLRRK